MIALEEKFLVNILYRPESEILNGVDINNINFEKLITLTSGHLMLPALFFNIQKKKAAYLFPEDFIDYIKGIYAINKARNEILLDEAKELSELLVEHNIKHFFLKGTALLLSNVFEDIGERMMCDIDLIIRHKDEEKIKKVLEKNNYFNPRSDNLNEFFKPQHLPRLLHKNKIIGIEIHTELLPALYRCIFNSKELIKDFKEEPKKNETPSTSFLFDHCIYGLQIDDQAFVTNHHSHRNIYDIYKLDCKKSVTIKNSTKIESLTYLEHLREVNKRGDLWYTFYAMDWICQIDFFNKLVLTQVDCEIDGDIFYPEINLNQWTLEESEDFKKDEDNEFNFSVKTFTKNS